MLALALALAVLPAAYSWWDARRLMPHVDEPAFAELWQARTARIARVLIATWLVVAIVAGRHAAWSLALACVLLLVAAYPSRKIVFAESWSLGSYLWHHVRFVLALFGPWVAMFLAVPLVLNGASLVSSWMLVAVVALWSLLGSRMLLILMRARPAAHVELEPRFREMLDRAKCREPRVYFAGTAGGSFVNAFAVPHYRSPAIVLSDELVAKLSPDETMAIFGHEVAHLEEIKAGKWLLRSSIAPVLCASLVVAQQMAPDSTLSSLLALLWPLLIFFLLAILQGGSRKHETESDLRSIELCGDPEALIRALEKIHALTKQPRRLAASAERRATHPSLARRIQSIREVAGEKLPGVAVHHDLTVRAADDSSLAMTLEADRLRVFEGIEVAANASEFSWEQATNIRSFLYSELDELRVDAKGPDQCWLIVKAGDGWARRVRLDPKSVAQVQARLDAVDHLLGAIRVPAARLPMAGRIMGLVALLAGLLPPVSWSLALLGLLVTIWPRTRVQLAAAVVAVLELMRARFLAPGLNNWNQMLGVDQSTGWVIQILAAILLMTGAVLGLREARPAPNRSDKLALTVVASFAALWCLWSALARGWPASGMELHFWARSVPSALMLLIGLAIALVTMRSRLARTGGWVTVLLVVVVVAVGTGRFRERWSDDLFAAVPTAANPVPVSVRAVRSFRVNENLQALYVSPDGQRLALAVESQGEEDYGTAYFLVEAQLGEAKQKVIGSQLCWFDSTRLATLDHDQGRYWLQTLDVESGTTSRMQLPGLSQPTLTVLRAGHWVVNALSEHGELIEIVPSSSPPGWSQRRWPIGWDPSTALTAVASTRYGAQAIGTRYDTWGSLGRVSGFAPPRSRTELWVTGHERLVQAGSTTQTVSVLQAAESGDTTLCLSSWSFQRSELWSLDSESGVPIVGIDLNQWYWPLNKAGTVLCATWTSPWLLVQAEPLELLEVQIDGHGSSRVHYIADYRDRTLAAASYDEDGTTVNVFELVDEDVLAR